MERNRIGPKIKELRKSKSLTQKQLADALGYSDKSMITHIEKGDSDMTYEKIQLLLKTYDLDANILFDIEEKPSKYKANGIKFIEKGNDLFVEINQSGIDAFYRVPKVKTNAKIKYLLMDLDGTTVQSEEFWMNLIERTAQELLNDQHFKLSKEDEPYVCGYTTLEHLKYVKNKYHYPQDVNEAFEVYNRITKFELDEIMEGRGNINAFKPRPGLKEFLLKVKSSGIKIGLATSGLDYKAIPEIVSAFKVLDLGDPLDFYDRIMIGGNQKLHGQYGRTGELSAKPHPWVYRELAMGLGIKDFSDAIVLEDSASGVTSARIAGFNVIGFNDGNLISSGLNEQCIAMVNTFQDVIEFLKIGE